MEVAGVDGDSPSTLILREEMTVEEDEPFCS